MKVDFQKKVRAYKNNVAGNYKFIPADQIDKLTEQIYFSSRKYDGQTHFLFGGDGGNRTRVRKLSVKESTCLVWSIDLISCHPTDRDTRDDFSSI